MFSDLMDKVITDGHFYDNGSRIKNTIVGTVTDREEILLVYKWYGPTYWNYECETVESVQYRLSIGLYTSSKVKDANPDKED